MKSPISIALSLVLNWNSFAKILNKENYMSLLGFDQKI